MFDCAAEICAVGACCLCWQRTRPPAALPHKPQPPMQTLSSREISPLDSIVASVTMLKAGTAHNVIPDDTQLAGTLRALTLSTFDYAIHRIQSMAASIAGAYRCNVTVSWDAHPIYPPTVNAPKAWDFARGVGMECAAARCACLRMRNRLSVCRFCSRLGLCRLFGVENVKTIEPIMPAEDFSFFLQKVPGAMIFLGHFDEALGNNAPLHNPRYHMHEGLLARGAAYHAALASRFLAQGGWPKAECTASDGQACQV